MALLALAATLCSCETAANRRELYSSISDNGPWHDYQRRREAQAALGTTGVEPVSSTTTRAPRSAPQGPSAPLPVSAPPPPATTAPPPPVVPDQAPGVPPAPAPSAPAPVAPAPDASTPAVPAPATPQ